MKNFAIALSLGGLLLLGACFGTSGPPADSAKAAKAAADAGGACVKYTVRNADEYGLCKTHCRDDKNSRDGSCNNDSNCLQASGIKMEQCMQKNCEDGKKAARAASCYTD